MSMTEIKILDAKKRLILSILNGSNTKTQTIDKHNIIWSDIICINTNFDKIQPYIKDYLDNRKPTIIKNIDIIKTWKDIINSTLSSNDLYSNRLKRRQCNRFFQRHLDVLRDRRFDKRYEIPDIDKEYIILCDKAIIDYYKLTKCVNKTFVKKNL
jgi:hypothetical protein